MASERPDARAAGYQRWRGLLFVHWRVDAARLRPLVPESLEIETYDGDAWVGMVPFAMDRVRPWWSPPVPGISWFLETNVRTYVRQAGTDAGVWFFSLEASRRLAVILACRFWHLNYHFAHLGMHTEQRHVRYRSLGRGNGNAAAYEIDAELPDAPVYVTASPQTLEYFLLERYLMYARRGDGTMFSGRVHHEPYRYAPAKLVRCRQQLTAASGIPLDGPSDSALFSPGVDVEVFSLRECDG